MYLLKKLGTKSITDCKPHGPSVNFWKARNQIQNFGEPQGPSVYFTLIFNFIFQEYNNSLILFVSCWKPIIK
ncbi:hypothetical protein HanIR_Chr10g0457731 [Helianthus annuus]|nr:hypothetical protein HanIR_Chr10g0457731 [Helianthus annuus]